MSHTADWITYFRKIRFCKFSPNLSSPAFTNRYRYISSGQSFQCGASVLLYLMQLLLTQLHVLATNLLSAGCCIIHRGKHNRSSTYSV